MLKAAFDELTVERGEVIRVFGIYSTPAPARLFSFRKRKKAELKKERQAPGSPLNSKEELEL